MDINYLLLLRCNYNNILSYINSIIDEFDKTKEYVTNQDKEFFIFTIEENKEFFIERKKNILHAIELCNANIQNSCNHEFIEDVIDINPDESTSISYCKFCEFTRL